MADALKKVQRGDRLHIPASTYNAFIDAAADFQARQRNIAASRGEGPPTSTLLVRNDSGEDVPRFGVLGIDRPIIAPGDDEDRFANQVALSCLKPDKDKHRGRFVILAEPLKAGKTGRAHATGVCPARITDDGTSSGSGGEDGPKFADVEDAETGHLQAMSDGTAAILWMDDTPSSGGDDSRWAIIRIGNAPASGPFLVKVTKDGGEDGDATTAATWTYTVKSLSGEELGTEVEVLKPRSIGSMIHQTDGYALAIRVGGEGSSGGSSGTGGLLKLWDAGEVPRTYYCDEELEEGSSGSEAP